MDYKNTKYGKIPIDWSCESIETYVTSNSYGPRFSADLYDDNGNCKVIRGTDVKRHGKVDYSAIPLASISEDVLKKHKLEIGDLVVVTTADCGVSFVFNEVGTYMPSAYMVRLRMNEHVDSEFLSRFFETPIIVSQVIGHIRKGTIANLPGSDLLNFKFFKPPLPEQKKIAKILSTVDGHIDEVDGMIEDLKELKKGLMQKLLTEGIGHTEFKDSEVGRIPVEWEVKTFESICVDKGLVRGPFGGALKKEFFVEDGYKVYEQKNAISKSADIGDYYVDYDKYKELERFAVDEGDFIVSCSGTIGRIFQIPPNHKPGVINQALLKVTLNTNMINDDFFYQYFEYEKFQNRIIDSTQGGAMKNLVGMPIIKKTMFPLPPIDEQQRIADILGNIDERIVIVNQEKDDLNELKKGLMQQLLTGKVRVMI